MRVQELYDDASSRLADARRAARSAFYKGEVREAEDLVYFLTKVRSALKRKYSTIKEQSA